MMCISDLYDQYSWTKQRNSSVNVFREQYSLLKSLKGKEGLAHRDDLSIRLTGFLTRPGRRRFLFSLTCPLLAFDLGSCQNKTSLLKCSTCSVLFNFATLCLAASNLFMRRNNTSLVHVLRNPLL